MLKKEAQAHNISLRKLTRIVRFVSLSNFDIFEKIQISVISVHLCSTQLAHKAHTQNFAYTIALEGSTNGGTGPKTTFEEC